MFSTTVARLAALSIVVVSISACSGGRSGVASRAFVWDVDAYRASASAVEPLAPAIGIAHRGYSAVAPENTKVAVVLGVDAGAEFVEIDVQMSADGGIVVMHDTTLARTTNAPLVYPARSPWNVSDFMLDELRQLDAGTWYGYGKEPLNFDYAGEPVPDLRSILDALKGRAGLLLEVKSPDRYPGIEAVIAAELEDAGWVHDGAPLQPLIVQSFNWASMETYAQLHPEVPVGLLGNPPSDEKTWSQVSGFADWINPSHSKLSADIVADIHRRGMRISPYTVNDAERMRELLDWGVDGVITDQPVRYRLVRDQQQHPDGEFVLANSDVSELSGMAQSLQHAGVYWGHNDSGDQPRIFAFDQKGRDLGTVAIVPAAAADWEDMASYRVGDRGYLLIGDVGDNGAIRPFVNLYVVAEPAELPPFAGNLTIEKALTVVYPDGARDCEGVAVDADEGMIYLLSKRDSRPRLYRLPLDSSPLLPVTAEFVGEATGMPLPEGGELPEFGDITNVSPTGFAFSPDGTYALVVTLEHSYRFRREPGQSWMEALNGVPTLVEVPDYRQIESGDFVGDGPGLMIGSEGVPAAIYATSQ